MCARIEDKSWFDAMFVSLMIFGCHFNMFNNGLFLGIQFRLSRAVECESENRSKTFFSAAISMASG